MALEFSNTDSKEEVYFSWWLDDLVRAGFVYRWEYQSVKFELSPKFCYAVVKRLKTKVRIDEKTLLQPHTYTPDFVIYWAEKARGIFFNDILDGELLKTCACIAQLSESHIDVKPPAWGKGNSFMEVFKINQKMTYKRHGVFVQPIVCYGKKTALFESTFCPERFRMTDKSMAKRKINFKALTLNEFLEGLK